MQLLHVANQGCQGGFAGWVGVRWLEFGYGFAGWVFDASLTGYLAKQPVSSAAGFKTPTCKTLAGFYNPPPPPPRGPPWPPGAPRGWGCDGRDM
jgi:hypothetical protein